MTILLMLKLVSMESYLKKLKQNTSNIINYFNLARYSYFRALKKLIISIFTKIKYNYRGQFLCYYSE